MMPPSNTICWGPGERMTRSAQEPEQLMCVCTFNCSLLLFHLLLCGPRQPHLPAPAPDPLPQPPAPPPCPTSLPHTPCPISLPGLLLAPLMPPPQACHVSGIHVLRVWLPGPVADGLWAGQRGLFGAAAVCNMCRQVNEVVVQCNAPGRGRVGQGRAG